MLVILKWLREKPTSWIDLGSPIVLPVTGQGPPEIVVRRVEKSFSTESAQSGPHVKIGEKVRKALYSAEGLPTGLMPFIRISAGRSRWVFVQDPLESAT